MIFESHGSDVIENQPVDVVDITDSQNRVVRVYFHQTTKLPVQQSWVWRDPETKEREEEVTRFSRYRDDGRNPVAAADAPRAKWREDLRDFFRIGDHEPGPGG